MDSRTERKLIPPNFEGLRQATAAVSSEALEPPSAAPCQTDDQREQTNERGRHSRAIHKVGLVVVDVPVFEVAMANYLLDEKRYTPEQALIPEIVRYECARIIAEEIGIEISEEEDEILKRATRVTREMLEP